jgi:TRAP-type C4-dicarboxylate transport system permease small subunit
MLTYIPNEIPREERRTNIIFSVLLFAYGSYGVWVNDLYIPGKRSRGVHLHDVPAWIMYAAMICACFVMLSVVADHYDRRNNERHYRTFAEAGKFVGWGLFGASLFWSLFRK